MCFFGKKKKAKEEAARKAAEEARLLEEQKAAEEAKKEEERKAAEAKRLEEVVRKHNEKAVKNEKRKAATKVEEVEETPVEEVKEETVETPVEEVKEEAKSAKKSSRKYNGKLIVYRDGENYRFVLKASNGELLCTSETYATKHTVSSAIETLKNNVENGVFSVYEDKHGRFQYVLSAKNNRIIIVGEIYSTRNNCLSAIESVKKFAATADIIYSDEDIKEYYNILEENFDANEVEAAPNGKIEVLMEEDKYYYVLKASNGVLLFTSKTFSSQKTCLANIENFKQLLTLNNFKIYMDKNKIFVFKIYNKVNSLMIIGEHYDSLAKCKSALTSVIRFGKEAKVIE